MTLYAAKVIFVIGIIIGALVFAFSAEAAHRRMPITIYKVKPIKVSINRHMLFDATPIADWRR